MNSNSWMDLDVDLAAFFDNYDRANATSEDGKVAVASLFAATFLAVDPQRAVAIAPDLLAAALPSRRRMFDDAGVGPIRRLAARQLTLDDRHVLVSADWTATRTGREDLRLSSMFLLRREPDGLRILVYLYHSDVAALLAS
jgi:hypothetical protein